MLTANKENQGGGLYKQYKKSDKKHSIETKYIRSFVIKHDEKGKMKEKNGTLNKKKERKIE